MAAVNAVHGHNTTTTSPTTSADTWWVKTTLAVLIITSLLYSIISLLVNTILIIGFEAQHNNTDTTTSLDFTRATSSASNVDEPPVAMNVTEIGQHRDSDSFVVSPIGVFDRNLVLINVIE